MRRAQEMRTDEFSRYELRESHATIQELTSQIQELQERVNYMSVSREFQGEESNYSGKLSHFPRTGYCSKSWRNAEPRPMLAT